MIWLLFGLGCIACGCIASFHASEAERKANEEWMRDYQLRTKDDGQ